MKFSNNSNLNLILTIRFVPQYNLGSMCTLAVTMVLITPSKFYQTQHSCKIYQNPKPTQKKKKENKTNKWKRKTLRNRSFEPSNQPNKQICRNVMAYDTHKNKRTVDCGYRFFPFIRSSFPISRLFSRNWNVSYVLTEFSVVIKNTCSIAS